MLVFSYAEDIELGLYEHLEQWHAKAGNKNFVHSLPSTSRSKSVSQWSWQCLTHDARCSLHHVMTSCGFRVKDLTVSLWCWRSMHRITRPSTESNREQWLRGSHDKYLFPTTWATPSPTFSALERTLGQKIDFFVQAVTTTNGLVFAMCENSCIHTSSVRDDEC